MKFMISAALILMVAIWLGVCAGHFCDRKAEERRQKAENLIEELSR